MNSARPELAEWLAARMKEKNWSIRETAKRANLSHPVVSDVLKGFKPTAKTCKALARLFGEQDVTIMRMAGVVDSEPGTDTWVEEKNFQLSRLRNPRLRRIADNLIQGLVDQQEQEEREGTRTRGKTKPA